MAAESLDKYPSLVFKNAAGQDVIWTVSEWQYVGDPAVVDSTTPARYQFKAIYTLPKGYTAPEVVANVVTLDKTKPYVQYYDNNEDEITTGDPQVVEFHRLPDITVHVLNQLTDPLPTIFLGFFKDPSTIAETNAQRDIITDINDLNIDKTAHLYL